MEKRDTLIGQLERRLAQNTATARLLSIQRAVE